MGLSRNILLWASQNAFLRERVPKYRFVRRAVRRFMPGEELADALATAEQLRSKSMTSIITRLGENVTSRDEADGVRDHYLDALDQIKARGLDTHVSTKLTQLGLDIDPDLAFRNMLSITRKAERLGNVTWIDMEQSSYVDVTLDVYERIRAASPAVGICLQSYLRRTPADLDRLMPLMPAIRMVKGAYKEPPEVAYPRKRDVDEEFLRLCVQYLRTVPRGSWNLGYGTHDTGLIRRITDEVHRMGAGASAPDYQMLYGIKTDEQARLAAAGHRVRVLISYGSYWYPWYMRRLAERPANIWFALKNLMG